jgi:hypothetical protein
LVLRSSGAYGVQASSTEQAEHEVSNLIACYNYLCSDSLNASIGLGEDSALPVVCGNPADQGPRSMLSKQTLA